MATLDRGAVMDIVVWLRSLGLEQYEAVFRENAVDVSVLPDLTDQDLEKLGVSARPPPQITATIAALETMRAARRSGERVPAVRGGIPRRHAPSAAK